MQEIIQLDKELFLHLNNLGCTNWDDFWRFISYKFSWIPFYVIILFLLWQNYGWKKTLLLLGLTFLMVVATDQITNLLKDFFKRPRPCFTEEFEGIMRPVGCERRGRFGFTSAHATNHFALALFLGMVFRSKIKWFIVFLLIWASFIAYSRIYLGVHFPLDVSCGALLGLIIGWLFYRLYQWILQKYSTIFLD
ncbi:MAG: phosphatase PAP2 family protein [Moheibacter sp.]